MARPVLILDITETERTELQRRLNSPTTAQRDSLRAAIVLRRGEGIKQEQVAEQLGRQQGLREQMVPTLRA